MKITVMLCLLNIHQLLHAAPAKGIQLDQNMHLAMLELSQKTAQLLMNDNGTNNSVPLTQAKINLEVKKPTIFPADCLTWNTSQINEKARKHHG